MVAYSYRPVHESATRYQQRHDRPSLFMKLCRGPFSNVTGDADSWYNTCRRSPA